MRFVISLLTFALLALGTATPAEAGTENQLALPVLSYVQGKKVSQRCAWAPNDSSVCRARAYCEVDVVSATCAKYCHVNPYDVVCGDAYRPHHRANRYPTFPVDSPYPWARTGGTWCDQNRWHIACQDRYLFPWN